MSTIYLYVKQHSVTGLKYFGKTIKKDPYKYFGSGKRWSNHIKKHGKEYVITTDVWLFTDIEECKKFALYFSQTNNIVESKEWANLCEENGTDGGLRHNSKSNFLKINTQPKPQWVKDKIGKSISKAQTGRKQSEITKKKRSESLKNKPTATCPHCGLTAKMLGKFTSYHFNNCKSK